MKDCASFPVVEVEKYINLSFFIYGMSLYVLTTKDWWTIGHRPNLACCLFSCEQSFIFTRPWQFIYELSMAIFTLQWQSWVVVIKTVLQCLKYLLSELLQKSLPTAALNLWTLNTFSNQQKFWICIGFMHHRLESMCFTKPNYTCQILFIYSD